VSVERVKSDSRRGVEVDMGFDQAGRAKGLNRERRKKWWFEARELREGPLLALVDGEPPYGEGRKVVFFLVSKRIIAASEHNKTEERGKFSSPIVLDLAGDAKRAMITLRLANPTDKVDQSSLISLASSSKSPSRRLILVEFPAVLFNSFEGVLRCLQALHKNPSVIPFATWLASRTQVPNLTSEDANTTVPSPPNPASTATTFLDGLGGVLRLFQTLGKNRLAASDIPNPTPTSENAITTLPPPNYLASTTASLDLSCISTNNTYLTFSQAQDPYLAAKELEEKTTLDTGQAHALVSALRHEVALIQGPPGTGKSFVGIQMARCLLRNRNKLKVGPILCM
jgi:hypothetical protein